jgi:hypothetical protein
MTVGIRGLVLVVLVVASAACAAADAPVGWRNDGTGRFPDARPPTEWSSDKNVLWKVELPGHSYAAPIVVGENLFVVSDPAELLCVRRSDGKVLWRKSLSDVKAPAGGKGGFGKGGFGKGGGKGGGGGRSAGNTRRPATGNTSSPCSATASSPFTTSPASGSGADTWSRPRLTTATAPRRSCWAAS